MNKNRIRLTESDLHKIIKESMKKVLNEIGDSSDGQYMLGRTAERAAQRADRTYGVDRRRYDKTFKDAYSTAAKASKKHLGRPFGGTNDAFEKGRDDESDKWEETLTIESKNMNKNRIRLTESDLHRIVKESVRKILKESDETAWEYSHLSSDEGIFIVVANFYDYTYCFEKKEIGRFDNSNEAKQYAIRMIRDKNFINDLIDDIYSEMDEGDETNVDDVNIEVYQNNIDEGGHNVIFTTKGYRILNNNI